MSALEAYAEDQPSIIQVPECAWRGPGVPAREGKPGGQLFANLCKLAGPMGSAPEGQFLSPKVSAQEPFISMGYG
jgi:hypothetical protein